MRGDWRSLIGSRDPRFTVKGHELAYRLYGDQSRFAIYEVRCIEKDGHLGVFYSVRDAQTISDAELKAGARPKIVAYGLAYGEAEAFCDRAQNGTAIR
jgi:hypothetical protein